MKSSCASSGSCNGMHSCRSKSKDPSDYAVGLDKKRKDLIATPKFKKVMAEYSEGTLKSSSGADVNSRSQAAAIAASESGQSYNEQRRKESKYDRFGVRSK